MEITDKTWEEIFREILASGNLKMIIVACLILGLAVGVILTSLYYEKIRFFKLSNDLASKEEELKQVRCKLDELQSTKLQETELTQLGRNAKLAQYATQGDVTQLPSLYDNKNASEET